MAKFWKIRISQIFIIIEKIHLDDLDVLDTLKLLWLSVVKLAKKFNSTSFNLRQEVFIRRDEDWPEKGWYLLKKEFDTWQIKDELWSLIFTPCYRG